MQGRTFLLFAALLAVAAADAGAAAARQTLARHILGQEPNAHRHLLQTPGVGVTPPRGTPGSTGGDSAGSVGTGIPTNGRGLLQTPGVGVTPQIPSDGSTGGDSAGSVGTGIPTNGRSLLQTPGVGVNPPRGTPGSTGGDSAGSVGTGIPTNGRGLLQTPGVGVTPPRGTPGSTGGDSAGSVGTGIPTNGRGLLQTPGVGVTPQIPSDGSTSGDSAGSVGTGIPTNRQLGAPSTDAPPAGVPVPSAPAAVDPAPAPVEAVIGDAESVQPPAAPMAAAAAADLDPEPRATRRRNKRQVPGITTLDAAADAEAIQPLQASSVIMYMSCNYRGSAGQAGPGNFRLGGSAWDNTISALTVPAGWKVTLWDGPSYTGRSVTITSSTACLSTVGFDNMASSMKVEAAGGAPAPPPPTTPPPATGGGSMPEQLLALVNQARASSGLGALTLDARLNAASQAHSNDQAGRRRMGHDGSDGSRFTDRAARAGYKIGWGGENVAAGQRTVQEVFNAWMNSSGHRANILNKNFIHMGAASASSNMIYWTQMFGTPQ